MLTGFLWPHLFFWTIQCYTENGPTYVGDEYSDPELMQYLCANKITEPGNNFSTYLTDLNPRRVLDLLEKRGFRLVGMSGMGQTCVWTMWKAISSASDDESDNFPVTLLTTFLHGLKQILNHLCLMAKVHIINVAVLDNPSAFFNPFQFEITFECVEDLQEDLEWRIIYVGSAESEEYDQVLDTVYVGPVPEGRHMFVFQADAPDPTKIPVGDVVGVTVLLLTCSYRSQEFIRVGYYINNDYIDPELRETPPALPQFDKLQRNILASNPRVTRFMINWDDGQNKPGENKNNGIETMSDEASSSNHVQANGNGIEPAQ